MSPDDESQDGGLDIPRHSHPKRHISGLVQGSSRSTLNAPTDRLQHSIPFYPPQLPSSLARSPTLESPSLYNTSSPLNRPIDPGSKLNFPSTPTQQDSQLDLESDDSVTSSDFESPSNSDPLLTSQILNPSGRTGTLNPSRLLTVIRQGQEVSQPDLPFSPPTEIYHTNSLSSSSTSSTNSFETSTPFPYSPQDLLIAPTLSLQFSGILGNMNATTMPTDSHSNDGSGDDMTPPEMVSSTLGSNRRFHRRNQKARKHKKNTNPNLSSIDEKEGDKSSSNQGEDVLPETSPLLEPVPSSPQSILASLDPFPSRLLMNEVTIQGSLSITTQQVQFSGRVQEPIFYCGFLSKTGKKNPSYHKYWFCLQDGMLKYYTDPDQIHYLHGNIPISSIVDILSDSSPLRFSLKLQDGSKPKFSADNEASALEWQDEIKKAQRAAEVGTDDVVITIPISAVDEFEMFDLSQDTVSFNIRSIDSDADGNEVYGLDEHCFVITSRATEAELALRTAMDRANLDGVTTTIGGAEEDRTHDVTPSKLFASMTSSAVGGLDDSKSKRFRARFGLPASERLLWTCNAMLAGLIPVYGKFYVGTDHMCFSRGLFGSRVNLIIPLAQIEDVKAPQSVTLPELTLRVREQVEDQMTVTIRFFGRDTRDDCEGHINAWKNKLQQPTIGSGTPLNFDDQNASIVDFDSPGPMTIVCVTIGSRGDVQPYIALSKLLQTHGHTVIIATHAEFQHWVEGHGIGFRPLAGNPAELMQLCIENSFFSPTFFVKAYNNFYETMLNLLTTAHKACEGADLVIESPSSMAGIHVAESLRIPYFRAFTMPWTRTGEFPHAFMIPPRYLGKMYNRLSYDTFHQAMWTALGGQINKWRKADLGLPPTSLENLRQHKVPFLYNFSPSVVPRPRDYPERTHITGYWFLDESSSANWKPDTKLVEFIKRARDDDMKLVYVGFGSIVVSDPVETSKAIVSAVSQAGIRCILSKGWSDRLASGDGQNEADKVIDESTDVFKIKSAPHDWLFQQVDAAVHHGGCGTTGASLRAGLPTVIKPFFADQYFYGPLVAQLGVGVFLTSLEAKPLAAAFKKVTQDEGIIRRAQELGQKIRAENGAETAVQLIYRELDYAKELVEQRVLENARAVGTTGAQDDAAIAVLPEIPASGSSNDADGSSGESDVTPGDATPRARTATLEPAGLDGTIDPVAVVSTAATSTSSRWRFPGFPRLNSVSSTDSKKDSTETTQLVSDLQGDPEAAEATEDEEWMMVVDSIPKLQEEGEKASDQGQKAPEEEVQDGAEMDGNQEPEVKHTVQPVDEKPNSKETEESSSSVNRSPGTAKKRSKSKKRISKAK